MYMGEQRRVGQRVAVLIAPSALWGGVELYDQCIRFTLELFGITHWRSAGIHTTGAGGYSANTVSKTHASSDCCSPQSLLRPKRDYHYATYFHLRLKTQEPT